MPPGPGPIIATWLPATPVRKKRRYFCPSSNFGIPVFSVISTPSIVAVPPGTEMAISSRLRGNNSVGGGGRGAHGSGHLLARECSPITLNLYQVVISDSLAFTKDETGFAVNTA